MSNDFWIAATAAVIIGGIWLYKKGNMNVRKYPISKFDV